MTKAQAHVPYVIERTGREERAYDLYSRLLKDRIVFLGTAINDQVANSVVAQMLFLDMENPKADIQLYINSPGGDVGSGLAIYDTMQYVQCDVSTVCIGRAASMGAVLLAGGTKGKRHTLPNSRVLIHQPWGGVQGTASDITIAAEEIVKAKKALIEILAGHTGQTIEKIERDTDRDYHLSAKEAVEYGLVDDVIETVPKKKAKE